MKPKVRKPWKDSIRRAPLGKCTVQGELVWVDALCIPLDPDSVEALHGKIAYSLGKFHEGMAPLCDWTGEANAVLAAIGIKQKARK